MEHDPQDVVDGWWGSWEQGRSLKALLFLPPSLAEGVPGVPLLEGFEKKHWQMQVLPVVLSIASAVVWLCLPGHHEVIICLGP